MSVGASIQPYLFSISIRAQTDTGYTAERMQGKWLRLYLDVMSNIRPTAQRNADQDYSTRLHLKPVHCWCGVRARLHRRYGNDTLTLTVNDQMYLGAGEAKSNTKQVGDDANASMTRRR